MNRMLGSILEQALKEALHHYSPPDARDIGEQETEGILCGNV